MQMLHPFDFARVARGQRQFLELRQIEVAKACGVGREWLVDFEHGKPNVSLALALKTLRGLGLGVYVHGGPTPEWTKPLTKAAKLRKARLDVIRLRGRVRKPRPEVAPPADYGRVVGGEVMS